MEQQDQPLPYAVFVDGSRQYRVSDGDVVRLDYRDAEIGSQVELGPVLLFAKGSDAQIGRPILEGARVVGEVVGHPTTKTYIQHFRKRKNYRRLRGHRQPYTAVRVHHILLAGQQPPAPAPAPATETPPPQQPPSTNP